MEYLWNEFLERKGEGRWPRSLNKRTMSMPHSSLTKVAFPSISLADFHIGAADVFEAECTSRPEELSASPHYQIKVIDRASIDQSDLAGSQDQETCEMNSRTEYLPRSGGQSRQCSPEMVPGSGERLTMNAESTDSE